jgi:hypothetical protein
MSSSRDLAGLTDAGEIESRGAVINRLGYEINSKNLGVIPLNLNHNSP